MRWLMRLMSLLVPFSYVDLRSLVTDSAERVQYIDVDSIVRLLHGPVARECVTISDVDTTGATRSEMSITMNKHILSAVHICTAIGMEWRAPPSRSMSAK